MALQWTGKDHLNTGNNEFMINNTSNEIDLIKADLEGVMMNTQSCMDHSILAIFEDSTIASEDKIEVEDDSESLLLTALTEILDSVEDDEGTISPFDTLPDSQLLKEQKARDSSSVGLHTTLRGLFGTAEARLLQTPEHHFAESSIPSSDKAETTDGQRKSKPQPTNVAFTQTRDEDMEAKGTDCLAQRLKKPYQKNIHCTASLKVSRQRMDNKIEVFTSTSLVNLVKLMHPYCLRVSLEERKASPKLNRGMASSRRNANHTLPPQGEILKYVEPSGDSDEEIIVDMVDDEAAGEAAEDRSLGRKIKVEARQLECLQVRREGCRNPTSKRRKKVTFGPVLVTNIDESWPTKRLWEEIEQMGQIALSCPPDTTETPEAAPHSSTAPTLEPSSHTVELAGTATVLQSQGQVKPKTLSLQQYRQLCQKRLPLVEKQGNNTPKWPSLSEMPKELSPILCLQGTNKLHFNTTRNCCPNIRPETTSCQTSRSLCVGSLRPHSESKPSNHVRQCRLKHSGSKLISPPCSSSDRTVFPVVVASQGRTRTEKKPTVLSSDPPNPVLLQLPATKPAGNRAHCPFLPSTTLCSTEPTSRAMCLKRHSRSSLLLNQSHQSESIRLLQETARGLPPQPPEDKTPLSKSHSQNPQPKQCKQTLTTETEPLPKTPQSLNPDLSMQEKRPSSLKTSRPPSPPDDVHGPGQATTTMGIALPSPCPETPPLPSLRSCNASAPMRDSGIEASDLTSLLERFEETQETLVVPCCEPAGIHQPSSLPQSPILHMFGDSDLEEAQLTVPEKADITSTIASESPAEYRGQNSLSTSERGGPAKSLLMLPSNDVPLPLCTDNNLSTQEPDPAKQQCRHSTLSTQRKQPAKPKTPASRSIQIIDPQPLPFRMTQSSPSKSSATHNSQTHLSSSVSYDHDYCISQDFPVKATGCHPTNPNITQDARVAFVYKTLSASRQADVPSKHVCDAENQRAVSEAKLPVELAQTLSMEAQQDYRWTTTAVEDKRPCIFATPPPSPPDRGREKEATRRCRRSDYSDSGSNSPSSSSCSSCSSSSPSPKRKRFCPKRSESSSCSSSHSCSRSPPRRYTLRYSRSRPSRSRSKSWSQSRSPSRSPSPPNRQRRWREIYRSKESRRRQRRQEMRNHKLKAIDERRVVYVGRIRRSMTHDELKERFSLIGEVESVSLHFRDRSDSYGFVTFYNMEDAFAAIENGAKLRRPDELPFDICFGGRRQFCKSDYADLDSTRDADLTPAHGKFEDLDFDSLLKQAQKGLKN